MGVTERCRLLLVFASPSAVRFAVALTAAEVGVGDRLFPTTIFTSNVSMLCEAPSLMSLTVCNVQIYDF